MNKAEASRRPASQERSIAVLKKLRFGASAALVMLAAQSGSAADMAGRMGGITAGEVLALLDGGRRQVRDRSEEVDGPEYERPYGDRARHSLRTEEAPAARRQHWAWQDTERNPFRERGAAGRDGAGAAPAAPASRTPTTGGFACEGKRYCREMTSCAEARFYLSRCGVSRLDRDGDGDGVPCETICR